MILAIDTSGPYPVVALAADDGSLAFGARGQHERAHAEELAPLIRAAMAVGGLSGVAVGRGPGAFTGLRVGLVSARTLGWAMSLPVVGLCSLDVVAQQAGLTDGWVVTDARRGELYLAHYGEGRRLAPPQVLPRPAAAALTRGQAVCGDSGLLVDTDRRSRGTTVLDPDALGAVALRAAAALPPELPEPEYLRRPDVTMSPANRGR